MNSIFNFVYLWLQGLSWIITLSYHETNIIVFYILIPVSWVFLYELPKRKFKYTVACLRVLLICVIVISFTSGFKSFSEWFFVKSQDFLNAFPFVPDPNLNYVVSSVVICVIIPLLIYIPLIKRNWIVIKTQWKYILLAFIVINLPILYGALRYSNYGTP